MYNIFMYKNNYVTRRYEKNIHLRQTAVLQRQNRQQCIVLKCFSEGLKAFGSGVRTLFWHFSFMRIKGFPSSQKLIMSSLTFTLAHTYIQPDTKKVLNRHLIADLFSQSEFSGGLDTSQMATSTKKCIESHMEEHPLFALDSVSGTQKQVF